MPYSTAQSKSCKTLRVDQISPDLLSVSICFTKLSMISVMVLCRLVYRSLFLFVYFRSFLTNLFLYLILRHAVCFMFFSNLKLYRAKDEMSLPMSLCSLHVQECIITEYLIFCPLHGKKCTLSL